MLVGEVADDGGGDGLEEGEEGAEGAAEEDNVVAGVDGAGKGGLVGVQVAEDVGEEGLGAVLGGVGGGFDVAVELEEVGEQGQDEGEGDLWRRMLEVTMHR